MVSSVSAPMPISVSAKTLDAMKLIFHDSKILEAVKMDRTKISYIIVHALGPYFHEELKKAIMSTNLFSVAFDESLNKVSDTEQLDLIIRYWSETENKPVTRYFTSAFLGHTTAADLLQAIKINLDALDLQCMLQISMDGRKVNKKLLNDLTTFLSEIEPNNPKMFDLGTCGLHVVHNAFKTGMQITEWNIVGFLRAIYNIFKEAPARKADYIYYTQPTKFSKKFCERRWIKNGPAAKRAQEILGNLKKFVNEYIASRKKWVQIVLRE